jgi:hypothetical protein
VKRIRPHLTYANVMSTLAVFLLLGGATAFAVSKALPRKSVGTKQLKNGAVTASKLNRGAVSAVKIRKGAVTGAKAKESTFGQVPSAVSAAVAANATTAEGPAVFAHVSGGGVLLDGRSLLVTVGERSLLGEPLYYCFSGIPFEPRGLVASPDYRNESPRFNTMLQVALTSSGDLGGTGCPVGTQAFVHGARADNDAHSPVGFYVLFFR